MHDENRKKVKAISKAFAQGLEEILGRKLFGACFYGGVAFHDDLPTGDIDFQVILRSKLTGGERLELEKLHEELGEKYPPLGSEMDGYYLLLDDAGGTEPPRSQMWSGAVDGSWALHREHILEGRRILLYGPDPSEYLAPTDWTELEEALYGELGYASDYLDQYPDYCILNLCRIVYSFETGEVVISKSQASKWAMGAMSRWKDLISLARKSYMGEITEGEKQTMSDGAFEFFDDCCNRIESAGDVSDD